MTLETTHIDARIHELLLGDVSDDERDALEAHVAGCPRCARELMQAADAFAALALALPAEPPPTALRARLLDEARPPRLHAMLDKLAALFDVSRAKARALLDKLDDPREWQPGPVEQSWIIFAEAGPRAAGAFVGFVKMGKSVRWPMHRHVGVEEMLVLDGGFRQDDGVEVHPGDLHVMPDGSRHRFDIFDDEDCVSAVVIRGGVEFEKE